METFYSYQIWERVGDWTYEEVRRPYGSYLGRYQSWLGEIVPKFLLSEEMERGLDFGTMRGVKIEL